jgi:sulfur relay (sulfurtransferase) complex TusBCD TusD component (DsrE family)
MQHQVVMGKETKEQECESIQEKISWNLHGAKQLATCTSNPNSRGYTEEERQHMSFQTWRVKNY